MDAVSRPLPRPGEIRQGGVGISAGQLTYTSFDTGTGTGGGWQVKQASETLDPGDQELLRARVSTALTPVDPLPQFPTPDQVQARTRRLMYTPVDGGRGAYWHTVAAGADGSGRPGNVFAHTLLEAESVPAPHRPIDRWCSPDWLVPYGARDVVAAEFSSHTVRPGDVVTRDTVIDFLLDPDVWRVSLFAVLLDAAVRAIAGGPPVVFGAESVESAAMWIGAVSHFLSKTAARKLAWSTFDRAPAVPAVLSYGVHLIAVPLGDLAALEPFDRFVLLAETDEPSRGEYGGQPNVTNSGIQVPVVPLSQIAEAVLIDADVVRRVLRTRDSVVERVSDEDAGAAWALAMAIELERDEDLADAADDCALVIARSTPPGLLEHPDLYAAASAAVARKTGTSPEDALAVLTQSRRTGSKPSMATTMALQVYVERAVSDRDWLMTAPRGQFDAPPPGWAPPELTALAAFRVDEMLDDCASLEPDSPPSEELAVAALRMTDLLTRAAVIGAEFVDIVEKLQRILEQTVPTVFFDDYRVQSFVGRVGALDAEACRLVLQPVIVSLPGMNDGLIGSRLSRGFLDWVMPYAVQPRPLDRVLAESSVEHPDPEQVLNMERIVGALYTNRRDPKTYRWRPQGLVHVLRAGDLDPQLEDVFFGRPAWVAQDLAAVLGQFGDRVPSTAAWWTVLEAPMDGHLGAVMEHVLPRPRRYGSDPSGVSVAAAGVDDDLWRRATPPPPPGSETVGFGAARPETERPGRVYMGKERRAADDSLAMGWAVQPSLPSPRQQALHELVRLRRITTWGEIDWKTIEHGFSLLLAELAESAKNVAPLPADVLVNLTVLHLAQRIRARSTAPVSSWASPQLPVRTPLPEKLGQESLDRVTSALLTLCRSGVLEVNDVADTAFLVSPDGPGFDHATDAEKELGRFGATAGEQPTSLLDRVVDALVAERYPVWIDGPDSLPDSVVSALESRHRHEEIPSAYRKFAKRWLEARGVDSGGSLKSLFRRRG